jgi:hypothetical protein
MLRKPARRSFTVEIKHRTASKQGFILPKPPRSLGTAKRPPNPMLASTLVSKERVISPVSGPAGAPEPRRILPSLIAWEPSTPEPELEVQPEPPLPRVRRIAPGQTVDEAPPCSGEPSEAGLEPSTATETARSIQSVATPPRLEGLASSPSTVTPISNPRGARLKAAKLSRAERWKRRLPRACW